MNWTILAVLISALAVVGTGLGVSWRMGAQYAELRARDDAMAAMHATMSANHAEQRTAIGQLSTALVELPHLARRVDVIESVLPRVTSAFQECPHHVAEVHRVAHHLECLESDMRAMNEKLGHMRGRLDSSHDIDTGGDSES